MLVVGPRTSSVSQPAIVCTQLHIAGARAAVSSMIEFICFFLGGGGGVELWFTSMLTK
jgi:hypothetical protein